MIRTVLLILVIVAIGAAVLTPIFVMIEPDPLPGDFLLRLGGQQYSIPVTYSLCASAALALLYWVMRR